jgi:O-antigen/teichoic acid export membrane protein
LFGEFALLNGILALLQGILLQPMAQAALRYYPEFAAVAGASDLKKYLFSVFLRRWLWCAGPVTAAAIADTFTRQYLSVEVWLLLALALALESWKAVEIVMLNAARRQAAYATLYTADSIARPAGMVLAAWAFDASLKSLLLGQSVGVLLVLIGFAAFSVVAKGGSIPIRNPTPTEIDRLKQGMRRFAAPLLWLPIVGWVSGLADRYIVGGMLGLAQAGIYAAAYGLASRPLIMIGGVSDATLRQVLYAAVAKDDGPGTRRTLALWVGLNLLLAGMAAALLGLLSVRLVDWLLAKEYRSAAAGLLPWLALGYVPLLVAQAFERLAYARQRTRAITLVQAASAALAIIAATLGAHWGGLMGVALAVPVYYSLQLLMTIPIAIESPGRQSR